VNVQPDETFDLIVVGGGSGGYATALRAAQLGLATALVERDKLGGTCLHSGCIPTKALLHAAEVADVARDGATVGVRTAIDGIDTTALHAFTHATIDRLYSGLKGLIGGADHIEYVQGTGRLVDSRTVDVDGRRLRGSHIVLASGSVARTLPGIEIGGRVLTSSEALELEEIPDRVVIIGGSVIGVEFASAWRSLGSEVTIVEALPRLVPLEDASLSKQLERAFRRRKIIARTNAPVAEVEQVADHATVLLESGDKLEADYVLVAVGRGPATENLGLEAAGVATDGPWIATNERLATSVDGIFAVGDVVRGLQLAHRGFAHGIFVAEEIAGLSPVPVADVAIPRVTYCDPEIASVGLTEAEAREQYAEVEVFEYNLAGNGRSQIIQTAGVVKLVREAGGPLVGVHMIGSRMGEQVGEAALMLNTGVTPEAAARFVHAHPTQNEALGEAVMALSGKPLHTHA
jgi:dihydrolipoamide dehydrogenase